MSTQKKKNRAWKKVTLEEFIAFVQRKKVKQVVNHTFGGGDCDGQRIEFENGDESSVNSDWSYGYYDSTDSELPQYFIKSN